MVGAIIACIDQRLLKREKQQRIVTVMLLSSLAFCIIQFSMLRDVGYGLDFAIMVILLLLLIFLFRSGIKPNNSVIKVFRPLAFIASISYPLYLIHQNIGYIIIMNLEKIGFINEIAIVIPIVLMIGIAFILHKYIEKPLISISNKLLKRNKGL